MADITFVVHSDWLDDLEDLSIERQDQIIADMIRAGCERELAHSEDKDLVSKVKGYMRSINVSKKKYEEKCEQGKQGGGRNKKINDEQIEALAREGYSSKEIAAILNCSKSAIDHSAGWRNRKN